jgi:hypothetical protein
MNKTITISLLISLYFSISTKAQTPPSYVPTTGLLAWYAMEGNGNDASGSGNNATNNGVTFVLDRFNNTNSAGSFDGISSYLQVATPTFIFSQSTDFTYSFWIKKQTQPSAGIVMMTGSSVSGNFCTLIQGTTNQVFGTNMQQSPWFYTNCPHTLNIWDHYVATYNSGVMKLYKNAVYQSTITNTSTTALSANLPLFIGKGFGGGNFLGLIDDVGIWNRELTQTEISALQSGCNIPITTNPISQSVSPNDNIQFIASSTNPNVTYRWQTDSGTGYVYINNGGQYSGALDDTLNITAATLANNGQLFRCIITVGTCAVATTVATLTVGNVGIDEITKEKTIVAYPNPAANQITLKSKTASIGSTYQIIDQLGKVVLKGEVTNEDLTINISNLQTGNYLIYLDSNPLETSRFVKQ